MLTPNKEETKALVRRHLILLVPRKRSQRPLQEPILSMFMEQEAEM
jgi:hypothetical protein